jgi:hypothetical protein
MNRGTLHYRPKPLSDRKQKLELEIVRVSKAHPTRKAASPPHTPHLMVF